MSKPLRKCRECGLEAWIEEDLELFKKDKESLYKRENICKKCASKLSSIRNKKHPLNGVYSNMRQRCYNPKNPSFHRYGDRGIIVCEEWRNDRQAFIDWANQSGFKRELQIDRRNNDGPYAPWNCRWVTRSQQNLNRRDTVTNLEKGTRICQKCKIEKVFSDFYPDRSTLGVHGLQYLCKVCDKKDRKERR